MLIATINLTVDPEKIYASFFYINKNRLYLDYAENIEKSKYGLFNEGNELRGRYGKRALAIYSKQKQCAVIGSSHIQEVSSYRNRSVKTLPDYCSSLMNLGVSGGTLEDYMAISNMLLERNNKFKTVVFGIDPWALNFDRDNNSRWVINKDHFDIMQNKLKLINKYNISYEIALLVNLINLEYFVKSVYTLFNTKSDSLVEIKNKNLIHADKFNLKIGHEVGSVTLPDGSWAYGKEYIKTSLAKMEGFNGVGRGDNHRLESSKTLYDVNAINAFKDMIVFIQKSGMRVIFVLSPYHQKTFETGQQIPKTLDIVEKKIHEIAKSLKLTVIGSYRAKNLSCSNSEFYDYAHPTYECIAKLTNMIQHY